MSRLSDAFFVPSQSDLEFIKDALKEAGLTDEEIKSKPWHFYKRRVRRSVPNAKDLEANLKKVFDLFADVVDVTNRTRELPCRGAYDVTSTNFCISS